MNDRNCMDLCKLLQLILPSEERGIDYCVLSNLERLSDSSDVDLVVASNDFDALVLELRSNIRKASAVLLWEKKSFQGKVLSIYFPNMASGFRIDIYTRVLLTSNRTWPTLIYSFGTKTFLDSSVWLNGIRVASGQVFAVHQILRKALKNDLDDSMLNLLREKISNLGKSDFEVLMRQVAHKKEDSVSHDVLTGLYDRLLSQDFCKHEVGEYVRKNRHVFLFKKDNYIKRLFRRTLDLQNKKGLVIVFMGPDGSGKSTLIESVMEALKPCYGAVEYNHLRPYLFRNVQHSLKGSEKLKKPHDGKLYNHTVSLLKLTMLYVVYLIGGVRNILKSRSTNVVIFDRYFYDVIIDPRRFLLRMPGFLGRSFVAMLPKPDLVLALCGDSDIIYQRKQDLEKEEIERQVRLIKKLGEEMGEVNIVNCNQLPSDVFMDAMSRIQDVTINK